MATNTNNLETIYVRDISEEDAIAFEAIKSEFGFLSNNKVVKTLFHKYIEVSAKNQQLQDELRASNGKYLKAKAKIAIVRDFSSLLKHIDEE